MKHLVILLALAATTSLCAQVQVDLTYLQSKASGSNCLSINLSNDIDTDLTLHGQNYRIYYDASALELDPSSIASLLPNDSYSNAIIKQEISHVDASGFGTLSFESDLGFVNFYIDYNNNVGGALQIQSGDNLRIAEFCFEGEAPTNDNVLWASRAHTSTYATAFNEMKIIEANNQTQLSGDDIIFRSDMDSNGEVVATALDDLDVDYYPNPFSDRLTLKLNRVLDEQAYIQVYDLFGKLVNKSVLDAGATELIVDGADLLAGAYLIKVTTRSGYNVELKALKIK